MSNDNQWQPIETAPKDGTFILLYDKNVGVHQGRWIGSPFSMGWRQCSNFGMYDATHWMPLPPPPQP